MGGKAELASIAQRYLAAPIASYPDMYAAVEALCDRKFGKGGPHNADTPGAWAESALVRSSAQVHDAPYGDVALGRRVAAGERQR